MSLRKSMGCDVLFINPDGLGRVYGNLASEIMTVEPPVWAMMLSKAVEKKGFSTRILDCIFEKSSEEDILNRIKEIKPKLICMVIYGQHPSASTHTMYGARITSQLIKDKLPSTKILYVGGHVSALPIKTMEEEPCDFAAKGEGLETICDLLNFELNQEEYFKVRGLYYREGERILFGPPSKIVDNANMDEEFPGLDYKDIPISKYRAPNWFLFGNLKGRESYASIYTSLGCPHSCAFCCINAPFEERRYRTWSVDHLMDQFDYFHKQGVKNVKIADELFILKESHYLPICEELAKRDYGFNIWAFARIDSIKKEHLPIIKKAGINWLILGIESYSEQIRSGVEKGRFKKQDIMKVVKDVQAAGIHVHANFLFGLPEDDISTMQENLNFSLELGVETANFYCLMPYPGSPLYHQAVSQKLRMPSSWLAYSQHGRETEPMDTYHVKGEEVLTFRDQAWTIYHQDEKYLELVERTFGADTVEYIKSITNVKLERNHTVNRKLANERTL